MKSLVTGATGFIGSFVAEMLKERGHDVRLLVRSEKRLRENFKDGYEIIQGDVTQSPEDLTKAIEGCDYIFHVAGLIKGRTQNDFNKVNTVGTRNLCEAVKIAGSKAKRFLLVSSQAAIGPSHDRRHIVNEETHPSPVTFYGRSKLLGEICTHEYADEFPVTIVRPPAVYGPRDTGFLELFEYMAKGLAMRIGRREQVFSLIHGKDLARGCIEAALSDKTVNETYFLSAERPITLTEMNAVSREVLKPSKNKTFVAPVWVAKAFARWNDFLQIVTRKPRLPNSDKMQDLLQQYWICTSAKAKKDFGFETQISFKEGMQETADFYRDEGWIKVR
ncbi:MAG: NAD-dependent epimerase/dehydratase family protein [Planctomycetes bacterium]|nr:NAD-dependent epimerase/dehydratase family protein [Planctomycetota bacterium]